MFDLSFEVVCLVKSFWWSLPPFVASIWIAFRSTWPCGIFWGDLLLPFRANSLTSLSGVQRDGRSASPLYMATHPDAGWWWVWMFLETSVPTGILPRALGVHWPGLECRWSGKLPFISTPTLTLCLTHSEPFPWQQSSQLSLPFHYWLWMSLSRTLSIPSSLD